MRLFVAINFGSETKSRLLALRDELREHSDPGNFTVPDNLHLTLVFIGECNVKQIAAIKDAMNTVSFEPFNISLDRIGRFKRNGGDIWWVGVKKSAELTDLQRGLTEKLSAAGFALESRDYSPHITLARGVTTDYTFDKIEPFGETVSAIDLMKSERINGKLTYTSVFRVGK